MDKSQYNGGLYGADPYALNRSINNSASKGHDDVRGAQSSRRQPQPRDRPKSKHIIPGCSPWLLVETKLGRRFVHNPEKGESYWKFPPEVLKGVVEYDRLEREKRNRINNSDACQDKDADAAAVSEGLAAAADHATPGASPAPGHAAPQSPGAGDSDEYEEVEVTDDEEEEEHLSKRRKTEPEDGNEQPVEFNEDDMAYQLAAMGEDYGLDPGEYGDGGEELEEGAEGLQLTEEDSHALFRDMLSDFNISPYTTWENIVEGGQIIEDDRYTVLPNMKSRKEVWGEWSRERIQQLKEQREKEEKKDPRIPYMAFLQKYATPKLYWPEFRRKYKKEVEMRDTKLADKDKEKWYRDYINRMQHLHCILPASANGPFIGLKLPESTLKSDLAVLLKFVPLSALNRSTTLDTLPPSVLTDIRYISLKAAIRDPIIESHIATLPPAPSDVAISPEEAETLAKQRQERQRREKALADRQSQVEDEKRRQKGALQYSKGILREGELELERARKVGKEGLMGYLQNDRSSGVNTSM